MKYAGVIKNDTAAAPGFSLTFFTQGCPHKCPGCHNQETWDRFGGKDLTKEKVDEIIDNLYDNQILRNLCIEGGEPLAPYNLEITNMMISLAKEKYPDIKIYIWSGYTYEELLKRENKILLEILKKADFLIDGRYVQELRDVTLKMRGSSNQRIINLKTGDQEE